MEEDSSQPLSVEELQYELLECARYGEEDDLRTILQAGIDVNFHDENGNTALHRAAANGHTECMKILKDFGAEHRGNQQDNTPLHWAAQNGQAEAIKFIIDNYDIDTLKKNESGRSALTEAFSSKNTDCIELCLSHPSASEDKLLPGSKESGEQTQANQQEEITEPNEESMDVDAADGQGKNEVIHTMQFTAKGSLIKVRELPITRADHPFGSEEAPEDDTTGLGVWPASLLLSQWIAKMDKDTLQNAVVIELGAGCGLPALTAAAYCSCKDVYITDIHEPTLRNAQFNVDLNTDTFASTKTLVEVKKVNWKDESTYPSSKADILLGSDLVYDSSILSLLIKAVSQMLKPEGVFLYVAPDSGRDGMSELLSALASVGVFCVEQAPAAEELYANPLKEDDEDQYVLHFYDLSARQPFTCYKFAFVNK